MFPTTLIYSSHNRCAYIHKDWIVERALKSHDNKTILYLPISMGEFHQQEYGWGTFRWYFDQFRKWGLHAIPFYWNDQLRKEDVDLLFEYLANYEVVILGGGNSLRGMQRYRAFGQHFYNDPYIFDHILHQRQQHGKLTAGFSAGADQLCDYLIGMDPSHHDAHGFGLVKNVMVSLHFEWGREHTVYETAQSFPHFMVFGLPNDSGLAVDQGYLPSGNIWQVIEFVIDCSWDIPEDGWHIKTRQGLNIEHFYNDGRRWTFQGGDRMVRVMSPDNIYQEAWILNQAGIFDYWTQQPSGYHSIEHILAHH